MVTALWIVEGVCESTGHPTRPAGAVPESLADLAIRFRIVVPETDSQQFRREIRASLSLWAERNDVIGSDEDAVLWKLFIEDGLSRTAVGTELQIDRKTALARFRKGPAMNFARMLLEAPHERDMISSLRHSLESRVPDYYPPHISLTYLASFLRIAELDDAVLEEAMAESGLYSRFAPWSGQDWKEALAKLPRASVLLGDPGSGKSTLAAAITIDTLNLGRKALHVPLPAVAELLIAREAPEHGTAAELVVLAFVSAHGLPKTCGTDIQNWLDAGDVLIVLDSWDEVASAKERRLVAKWLHELPAGNRYLVTSRLAGYSPNLSIAGSRPRNYGVTGLQNDAVKQIARDWLTDSSKSEAFLRARSDIDGLEGITSSPVLLGLCLLCAPAGDSQWTRVDQVYSASIETLISQEWRSDPPDLSPEEVSSLFTSARSLAWEMATGHPSKPAWSDHIPLGDVADRGGIEVALSTGLMAPHGPSKSLVSAGSTAPLSQPYRWVHRTLHEHLAGVELAQRWHFDADGLRPFLVRALMNPTWSLALEHAAVAVGEFGDGDSWCEFVYESSSQHPWLPTDLRRIAVPSRPSGAVRDRMVEQCLNWYFLSIAAQLDPHTARLWAESNAEVDGAVFDFGITLGRFPSSFAESLASLARSVDIEDRYAVRDSLFKIQPLPQLAIDVYLECLHSEPSSAFPSQSLRQADHIDIAPVLETLTGLLAPSAQLRCVELLGALGREREFFSVLEEMGAGDFTRWTAGLSASFSIQPFDRKTEKAMDVAMLSEDSLEAGCAFFSCEHKFSDAELGEIARSAVDGDVRAYALFELVERGVAGPPGELADQSLVPLLEGASRSYTWTQWEQLGSCLLYTSPSPRD